MDALGPSIFAGLMNPEGILIEVNRPALAAAGLQPEDVLGKPFADTYWWAYSPDVQQHLRKAIGRAARGEGSRYDVQVRGAEDHLIDVDFSLQPLRDDQGTVVLLLPSARVTTEREATEKALRASNEKFLQLAEHITDAFWMRSPDMRELHYISPAYERIWGRSAASLYSHPYQWADFTHKEDRARVLAAFVGLTRDAPSLDIEYRIARPDGEIRWVRVRGFQVRDATGELIRLTGIVTDITDQKLLASQALRAQRMESIGTLAGGIAHDLNNVLAPILMSVSMLRELITDPEGLSVLGTLQGSAQRGAELVKQVLAFARGVEGERIVVNPLHLMRDLLTVLRETLPKAITLQFLPAPDLWSVNGDPTQMHQVFLNLCVNARDAMPEGGTLTISMMNLEVDESAVGQFPDAHSGRYVVVKVADTGTGIPVNVRERIFEPFFTTKEIGRGTGLGLSTSLGIVRSHAGFIDLVSQPGDGTTFSVYFPACTAGSSSDTVATVPKDLPRGANELILLVDDEDAIRKVGKRLLQRYGYRVLLAAEGAEALRLYAEHRADVALVITDMAMPVMGGPELIAALVALNPRVCIVGCSGLSSEGGETLDHASGLRSFLAKPYTIESMLTTIHEVLSRP